MKMDNMNSAKTESRKAVAFPDEETFQKIYEECWERDDVPKASESLQDAYKTMRKGFSLYLAEYDAYTFRYAYQCGYEAAMKKMELRVGKHRAMTPALKKAGRKEGAEE